VLERVSDGIADPLNSPAGRATDAWATDFAGRGWWKALADKASGKDVSDEDFKAAARILEGAAIDTGLAKMWQSQGLDYGKRLPPPVGAPPGAPVTP
jgi:hypothetical protein